ncbi:hypothetical protein [Methylogaea oryzae]|uniref:hypothetical protein n=1 Tax=Methylogaea oryzae TaxID=1295382 RepID=UPI001C3F2BC4|nr:hypothetical protein [Methylogaea oryzae]
MPGVVAMMMMVIPAILTAVGVVREKELAPSSISTPRRCPAWNSCWASRRLTCWWASPALSP